MRNSSIKRLWLVGSLFVALGVFAIAEDAKEEAIKRDRTQIQGTWRIVTLEIGGKKVAPADANKLSVVNGSDGVWSLRSEGKEISQGNSTIDPTGKPKTIDFSITEGGGKGNHHLGIYELGEKVRKLCFAPAGKERPTEFATKPGSEHILATFERQKTE